MPYIITTQSPRRTVWEGPRSTIVTEPPPIRTAVATLEEARERTHEAVIAIEPTFSSSGQPLTIPGTIGPLPDGTVIEVRRVDWHDLIAANGGLCGHPITACDDESLAEVIAAYNAR